MHCCRIPRKRINKKIEIKIEIKNQDQDLQDLHQDLIQEVLFPPLATVKGHLYPLQDLQPLQLALVLE